MELKPEDLRRTVDVASLPFATTADVTPREEPIAQHRAREALDFAMGMRFPGYNVYALGSAQTDKHELVVERLQKLAAGREPPDDWCYLQNFDEPARPQWVRLPAGDGRRFRHDMQRFLDEVCTLVAAALKSDEYQSEIRSLTSSLQERQSSDTVELEKQAKELDLAMLPTPNGFVFAPVHDGKVMDHEAFFALDEAERKRLQQAMDLMTTRLMERLRDYPQYERKLMEAQRELKTNAAREVVSGLLSIFSEHYRANNKLMAYLQTVEEELIENVDKLLAPEPSGPRVPFLRAPDPAVFLEQFNVNLIVDSSEADGASVLYESNPSLDNLVGKLEHRIEYGTPVTDFNLIRAGVLHRANGGFLVLDVERLIQKPFAWEALKRAVSDNSVRMESVSQLMNLTYSVSLEPEAIPLDVKIVLLGSRRLYHLLRLHDSDFDDLFKVVADFDDDVDWNEKHVTAYAGMIARTVLDAQIKHLDAAAVGRVLEYSSRLVEDRKRLSMHIRDIKDLLREAHYIANKAESELICSDHVDQAIDKRIYRLDRFREMIRENVVRGLILVELEGAKVGQINGLSVLSIGQIQFGQPMRITATARLGRGELIDIEREAHLGGRIHSKAVMIVSSFLGSRYAKDHPLSLQASLVFEQSYGGVEGDSASIAEVCALISAIIDRPIKQSLAVTGSMDQHGTVQAIGGVNEKIEAFFEICNEHGLTGQQGVIVPATNRDHLMLRQEVVDAVSAGQFHVYTMATVDDALALLFAPEGETTIDSDEINDAVRKRVIELYELRRRSVSSEESHDGG